MEIGSVVRPTFKLMEATAGATSVGVTGFWVAAGALVGAAVDATGGTEVGCVVPGVEQPEITVNIMIATITNAKNFFIVLTPYIGYEAESNLQMSIPKGRLLLWSTTTAISSLLIFF
jgi:hypothetical protein